MGKKGGSLSRIPEVVSELLPERVSEHFPVDKEPRIPTLDKPEVIESACPGWQVGGKRFPAVPIAIEDQVREIVDSVKAGAMPFTCTRGTLRPGTRRSIRIS